MNADAINAALEESEQALLRKQAKQAVRSGGPAHFFSESDQFDKVPGGMLVRRNNHTAALTNLPDGDEYGIKARDAA